MGSIQEAENDASPIDRRSTCSRRTFLQVAAGGISAASIAYNSSADAQDRAGSDIRNWNVPNIPDQNGRRVLVTGGNGCPLNGRSGLGYQQALALARAGADVTIASRNEARGQEAVRQIRDQTRTSTVRFERLDLTNLASVKAFAAWMDGSGKGLDLLINNAGVMGRLEREESVDGFERVFATNTLGHFVLTAQLLPMLQKGRSPRIVWVSSLRTSAALPLDDLQLARNYDYAAAYDHTKLANLMLAVEFERKSRARGWGIASLASHPGVARTNLIPDGPGLASREGWRFRMLPFMFQPAAQGALPTLYAATSPQASPGGYYGPGGFQGLRGLPGVATVPAPARDRQSATALWAALEHMGRVSLA